MTCHYRAVADPWITRCIDGDRCRVAAGIGAEDTTCPARQSTSGAVVPHVLGVLLRVVARVPIGDPCSSRRVDGHGGVGTHRAGSIYSAAVPSVVAAADATTADIAGHPEITVRIVLVADPFGACTIEDEGSPPADAAYAVDHRAGPCRRSATR